MSSRSSGAYKSWKQARRRCLLKSDKSRYYRDSGITLDPRWMVFENFLADMGERPDGMTLDRINPRGGYSRENCRWADSITQSRNRLCNTFLTHKGDTACISEWSERLGIERGTIRKRIAKGWPMDMILRPKTVKHHVTGRKPKEQAK